MDSNKRIRVLVVEDNQIAQKIARMIIESLNCEVDVVDNGVYAVQYFRENQYDLVFLDLGLPDKDGYAVASEMRAVERDFSLQPTNLIGLSVHTGETEKRKALQSGMNDYVVKPLTIEKCQRVLNDFCAKLTLNIE